MIQHLRQIDLSNNFLNGSLPNTIFNSSQLQVLSLSNNVISGELPELVGNLTNLKLLNLSDNAFAGLIPEKLPTLPNLTVVSLKSNYFSGSVPTGFNHVEILDLSSNLLNGSLPNDFGGENLRYLNLSYNKISGTIPLAFAKQISGNTTVDLSFNNLTGPIPGSEALLNQKTEFLSGNADLCAIVVGDLAGMALLALIILFIYQHREKRYTNPKPNMNASVSSNSEKKEETVSRQVVDVRTVTLTPSLPCSCLTIKEEETSEATSSDSDRESNTAVDIIGAQNGNTLVIVDGETNLELKTLLKASAYILGNSHVSIVYKAVLEDGRAFAVRRIGECKIQRMKEFENQVRAIAKLRHPNLVKLRGFCWGQDDKLLICDYVPNGSLATMGYRRGGTCSLKLSLEGRLKIAKGVARGLAFIHEKKHVHGNVKPSNILLNSEMEAVISDFGVDRLLTVGLMAYQAPETFKNIKASNKWDVYSFGVVLLELLTGRVLLERELEQWHEPGSVEEEKNRVLKMADVAIKCDMETRESVLLAWFKLGLSCACPVPQKRPSMKEALQILDKIHAATLN
uniref:Receptor protein kinase-like protein At4g34220 family n=1 Tax=Cajanus cajan TaxID=3821 RepID=A0A151U7R5_CAJCA|nr:Receptor protein kinase-like protein At4g34220 family [Cajanus cajan]